MYGQHNSTSHGPGVVVVVVVVVVCVCVHQPRLGGVCGLAASGDFSRVIPHCPATTAPRGWTSLRTHARTTVRLTAARARVCVDGGHPGVGMIVSYAIGILRTHPSPHSLLLHHTPSALFQIQAIMQLFVNCQRSHLVTLGEDASVESVKAFVTSQEGECSPPAGGCDAAATARRAGLMSLGHQST